MTKQDEINLFKSLVAHLPKDAEYLRAIFGSIECDVEGAIRNDFGCISFSERLAEQKKHRLEIAKLEERQRGLQAELKQLERKRDRMRDDIEESRKLALRVAQMV